MAKGYFSLAIENLKHRGLRSWLTMIGIFIGIAAVVSLITLGDGLRTAVTGQFSSLSTDKLIVQSVETSFGPPGSTAVRKLNEHDLEIIRGVNGVEIVIPRLIRTAKIEFNDIVDFKYVASMPQDRAQINYIYKIFDLKVLSGRLLNLNDKNKILIGSDFISEEDFNKPVVVGDKLKIQGKTFEVIGALEKSSTFQINLAALILEEDLKDVMNINDEIDIVVVKVSDPNKIETVAAEIAKRMRRDRNEKVGEEDFSIQTPIQAISSVNTILNIINIIVAGIAAISLIIGGIGIANTMYASVLERKREIGVMKAVGAENKNVLKIFIYEAGLLGLVGGIVGAILGVGFAFLVSTAANAYFKQKILLINVSYPLVLLSIMFSFLIGLLSGLLPAVQASRLKPVEALRG